MVGCALSSCESQDEPLCWCVSTRKRVRVGDGDAFVALAAAQATKIGIQATATARILPSPSRLSGRIAYRRRSTQLLTQSSPPGRSRRSGSSSSIARPLARQGHHDQAPQRRRERKRNCPLYNKCQMPKTTSTHSTDSTPPDASVLASLSDSVWLSEKHEFERSSRRVDAALSTLDGSPPQILAAPRRFKLRP